MSKETVSLSLDADLIRRARTEGDLAEIIEAALRRHLDGADRRWAQENALMVEALAGGAEEAKS